MTEETTILGYTLEEIRELDRWRKMNSIPTLWVKMALEPTVQVLLRAERQAAYEKAAKIADDYVHHDGDHMNAVAFLIRREAKETD